MAPGTGKVVRAKRAVLFAILLALLALAAVFLPVEKMMTAVQSWTAGHPSSAAFVVTASLAAGILLLLPLSLMLMLAGLLFGLLKGFIVSWAALMIAASAAFWTGRSFARPWVERKFHRHTLFASIDRAVRRKGFVVVLLTRLVMIIPYQLLNYALGLTQVRFRDALLATAIGSAPALFLFVYLGTTVGDVASIVRGDIGLEGRELMISAIALGGVVGAVLLIVRIAGRTLKEELLADRE